MKKYWQTVADDKCRSLPIFFNIQLFQKNTRIGSCFGPNLIIGLLVVVEAILHKAAVLHGLEGSACYGNVRKGIWEGHLAGTQFVIGNRRILSVILSDGDQEAVLHALFF